MFIRPRHSCASDCSFVAIPKDNSVTKKTSKVSSLGTMKMSITFQQPFLKQFLQHQNFNNIWNKLYLLQMAYEFPALTRTTLCPLGRDTRINKLNGRHGSVHSSQSSAIEQRAGRLREMNTYPHKSMWSRSYLLVVETSFHLLNDHNIVIRISLSPYFQLLVSDCGSP